MSQLHLLYSGSRFIITAYGDDKGACEVIDFLADRQVLPQEDEDAFMDLFKRHGDYGQIRNTEKCRLLEDGIFEYKARHGGRIAWFYTAGAVVVCACGVVKKKQRADPEFIRHAKMIRDRFKQEDQNGDIQREY
jgi:hypothetical protein